MRYYALTIPYFFGMILCETDNQDEICHESHGGFGESTQT